jgi:putative transposase
MGRPLRASDADFVYHALNRANGRLPLFDQPGDYQAFERVLAEACDRVPVRLLGYCLMPNHWHLVVWPRADGDLSRFVGWLTLTHTQRWHAHHRSAGTGHLYQGRFKSFPIQADEHLLTVCRYVERNPLRAGLVRRAQDWRWGSLWRRQWGTAEERALLAAWPVERPRRWLAIVNAVQTAAEVEAVQAAIRRGRPVGSAAWVARAATRLGLEGTLRPRGRPPQAKKGS